MSLASGLYEIKCNSKQDSNNSHYVSNYMWITDFQHIYNVVCEQCIVELSLRNTDLGLWYVQANVVSVECRIDRLEDELPSHGQFRDCSEQSLSQLMAAIIAPRVRGNAQHERLHSCLVCICHSRTTSTSPQDTRKWKRQLLLRMRSRHSISISPMSLFLSSSSLCFLVSFLSL